MGVNGSFSVTAVHAQSNKGQVCLALTDGQAHHSFLRSALCWLTKGKMTPDIVLFGALKCEVNLELFCGRWYGPVCRLSQVEVWLERLM